MSEYHHNYLDSNFNLKMADSYTLLVQLKATAFSYAVVNDNSLLVFAQNCALKELDNQEQLINLLSANYKKVVIGLPATGLTLVPNALFSRENLVGFAALLDAKDSEKVFAQTLDDQNAIVYKAAAATLASAEQLGFQNTVYTAKGWIKAVANSAPPSDKLYLEISGNTVQFLYFYWGSLRFYNTFEFHNADELAYFTGLVAGELYLNPAETILVLSGDTAADNSNFIRLTDFFGRVILNETQVLDLPAEVVPHQFLALAALSLCE